MIKRKIAMMLLAFAIFLPCVFALTACGDKDPDNAKVSSISVEFESVEYELIDNTITIPYGQKLEFDNEDFTLIAHLDNGKNEEIAFETSTTDGYTFTSTLPTNCDITPRGEYTVTFSYLEFELVIDVNVVKADVDMTGVEWDYTSAFTYNGTVQQVNVTNLPQGVNVQYSGNTATDAGDYTAIATFTYVDTENFNPINNMELSWKINPISYVVDEGDVTIDSYDFTYDGTNKTVVLNTTDSNVEIDEVTGNVAKNAGTHTINITFNYVGTSPNYDRVTPVQLTWVIKQANLTITANDATITYGADVANNDVEYSGFVAGEDESVLTGTLSYTYGNYEIGSPVGTYDIVPSGLTSNNYDISFGEGTLTVEKKDLTIKAKDVTIDYKTDATDNGVEVTGLVAGDTLAELGTVSFDFGGYVVGGNSGEYVITPSGLASDNYNITYQTGTLKVKADITGFVVNYQNFNGNSGEVDYIELPENSIITGIKAVSTTTAEPTYYSDVKLYVDEDLTQEVEFTNLQSYSNNIIYAVVYDEDGDNLGAEELIINYVFANDDVLINVNATTEKYLISVSGDALSISITNTNANLTITSKINGQDSIALTEDITNAEYRLEIVYDGQTYYFEAPITIMKSVAVADVVEDVNNVYLTDSNESYKVDATTQTIDLTSTYNVGNIAEFEEELKNIEFPVADGLEVTNKEIIELDGEYFIKFTITTQSVQPMALTEMRAPFVQLLDYTATASNEDVQYLILKLVFDGKVNNDTSATLGLEEMSGGYTDVTNNTIELNITSQMLFIELNNIYAKAVIMDSQNNVIATSSDGHLTSSAITSAGTYTLVITATDGKTQTTYTIVATDEYVPIVLVEVVYDGTTLTETLDEEYMPEGDFDFMMPNDYEMILIGYLGEFDEIPSALTLDSISSMYTGTMTDNISGQTFTTLTNVTLEVGTIGNDTVPCVSYGITFIMDGEEITLNVVLYLTQKEYPVKIQVGQDSYDFKLNVMSYDFGDLEMDMENFYFPIVIDEETAQDLNSITITLSEVWADYSYMVLIGDAYETYVQTVEVGHIFNSEFIDGLLAEGTQAFRVTSADNLTMTIPVTFVEGIAYFDIACEGFVGYIPEDYVYDVSFVRVYIVIDGVGELPKNDGGNDSGKQNGNSINLFEVVVGDQELVQRQVEGSAPYGDFIYNNIADNDAEFSAQLNPSVWNYTDGDYLTIRSFASPYLEYGAVITDCDGNTIDNLNNHKLLIQTTQDGTSYVYFAVTFTAEGETVNAKFYLYLPEQTGGGSGSGNENMDGYSDEYIYMSVEGMYDENMEFEVNNNVINLNDWNISYALEVASNGPDVYVQLLDSDNNELTGDPQSYVMYCFQESGTYTLNVYDVEGEIIETFTINVNGNFDETIVTVEFGQLTLTETCDEKWEPVGDFVYTMNMANEEAYITNFKGYLGAEALENAIIGVKGPVITIDSIDSIFADRLYYDVSGSNQITELKNVTLEAEQDEYGNYYVSFYIINQIDFGGGYTMDAIMNISLYLCSRAEYVESLDYPLTIDVGTNSLKFRVAMDDIGEYGDFDFDSYYSGIPYITLERSSLNLVDETANVTLTWSKAYQDYSYCVLDIEAYTYLMSGDCTFDELVAEGLIYRCTDLTDNTATVPMTFMNGMAFLMVGLDGFTGENMSESDFMIVLFLINGEATLKDFGDMMDGSGGPNGEVSMSIPDIEINVGNQTLSTTDGDFMIDNYGEVIGWLGYNYDDLVISGDEVNYIIVDNISIGSECKLCNGYGESIEFANAEVAVFGFSNYGLCAEIRVYLSNDSSFRILLVFADSVPDNLSGGIIDTEGEHNENGAVIMG